jgi:hypothetical protein
MSQSDGADVALGHGGNEEVGPSPASLRFQCYCFGSMRPYTPCPSSSGPAVKNKVSVG